MLCRDVAERNRANRTLSIHSSSALSLLFQGSFTSAVINAMCDVSLQVAEVRVCGPRYWELACSWRGGEASALAAVFAQGRVFVQRRSGALSYADDPAGVRSLLFSTFRGSAQVRACHRLWV